MATVQEILDAEIPPPTWAWRPTTADPLRSDFLFGRPDNGDPSGYTLNPNTGLFDPKGADKPRIYGPSQGLLVAPHTTNVIRHSSDATSGWALNGGANTLTTNPADSIFSDRSSNALVNAKELVTGGNSNDQMYQNDAGAMSGNDEVAFIIMEQGTADLFSFALKSNDGMNIEVEYRWSTDTVTQTSGSTDVAVDVLPYTGPNGGNVAILKMSVPSGLSGNVSGSARVIVIFPDRDGNGDSSIFHHAQWEQQANSVHNAPIVTGSSGVTVANEFIKYIDDGWHNENQGTFVVRFSVLSHRVDRYANILTADSSDAGVIQVNTYNPPYGIRSNTFTGSAVDVNGFFGTNEFITAAMTYSKNGTNTPIHRVAAGGSVTEASSPDITGVTSNFGDLVITGNEQLCVHKSVAYYPVEFSRTQLQAVTS